MHSGVRSQLFAPQQCSFYLKAAMTLHKSLTTTKKKVVQLPLGLLPLLSPARALQLFMHRTKKTAAKSALNVLLSGWKEQTFEEKFCSKSMAQLLCITLG